MPGRRGFFKRLRKRLVKYCCCCIRGCNESSSVAPGPSTVVTRRFTIEGQFGRKVRGLPVKVEYYDTRERPNVPLNCCQKNVHPEERTISTTSFTSSMSLKIFIDSEATLSTTSYTSQLMFEDPAAHLAPTCEAEPWSMTRLTRVGSGCYRDWSTAITPLDIDPPLRDLRVSFDRPTFPCSVKLLNPDMFRFSRQPSGRQCIIGSGVSSDVYAGQLILRDGSVIAACLKHYKDNGIGIEQEYNAYANLFQTGFVPQVYGMITVRDANNDASVSLIMQHLHQSVRLDDLDELGVYSPIFVTRLALLITVAVRRCHNAGYLINDIMDANIMVDATSSDNPVVHLIDFEKCSSLKGIRYRPMDPDKSQGCPHLAPEVVAGNPTSTQSDAFSLGKILTRLASLKTSEPSLASLFLHGIGKRAAHLLPNQRLELSAVQHQVEVVVKWLLAHAHDD